MVAFREASWNFPRQDYDFKEFRGFPGMELGIFRVAESSGEGRIPGLRAWYFRTNLRSKPLEAVRKWH